MSLTFASNLTKMIDAGLGGEVIAPDTSVAIGYRMQYNLVSGPVASWNDPEGGLPINIAAEFGPIQSGSGDPSPENVRPISGRQSVTVTRTGINVFDKSEVVDGVYINDINGTERQSADSKATGWISVVPGEKYYILTEQTLGAWGAWYDKNKDFIGSITGYLPSGTQEQTAPLNAAYMRLTCYRSGSGNIDTFAVNYPSTDHDYHAYDGQSVAIQLGQTVYGGRLNVTTGVMTVEWANIASYDGETLPGEWISDRDVYAPGTTPTTGAQVCYKLAEPLTVQLSPQTIEALKGQNNVWSDAGDVSVTWKEKLYTEGY